MCSEIIILNVVYYKKKEKLIVELNKTIDKNKLNEYAKEVAKEYGVSTKDIFFTYKELK